MKDFPYKGQVEWIEANTIMLVKHGSQAYGTNLPTSDLDVKGIAIPPSKYFLGYLERFEQVTQNEPDLTIFDIRKFFSLASDCNPNIIELLWVDDADVLSINDIGLEIRENRNLFLSKKARHTFSGYAMSQLKRIKGHYRWLKDPPKAPPTRKEFGLPERTVIPADQLGAAQSLIQRKLDTWEWKHLEDIEPSARVLVQNSMSDILADVIVGLNLAVDDEKALRWRAAGILVGLDTNLLELLDQERKYNWTAKNWESYLRWQKERNPERAALEAKYGYDCKHGMHLVRLMSMCREILSTGSVLVKRPDREKLLAIRNGAWTYEQLIEWAEEQDSKMEALYKVTTLPYGPDRKALDELCQRLVAKHLGF